MEDKYYQTVRDINGLAKAGLAPTFSDKELGDMKPAMAEIDKSLTTIFKGGQPRADGNQVHRLVNILLMAAIEKPLTDNSKQYITSLCRVASLYNMNVLKDDNLESVLVAITQLLAQSTSIESLLVIVRSWLPLVKGLANKPLAFDTARHYLEVMKDG